MSIAFLEVSALVRSAVADVLSRGGFQVSVYGEASSFLHHVEATHPEVAVIDLHGVQESLHLLGLLRLASSETRLVVVWWGEEGVPVSALVDLGVSRLVDGRAEDLNALLSAVGGDASTTLFPADAFFAAAAATAPQPSRPQLSPRERQVLGCLTAGHDNLKIAAELGICERTVKAHVSSLYRKLLVENRSQLVLRGLELGLAPVRQPSSNAPRSDNNLHAHP